MPPRNGSQAAQSPAPVPPPPQPSFRKVEGEDVNVPAGVNDMSSRSYGYNDFSFFSRPDHYIRYIEPIESELTNQVEYDMDEQDQEWLDIVNEERKKSQVGTISPEIFEIMMDRLEKEWFELMKHVPKQDMGLPSEDSTCAICDDGEGENSNAIVFCDGCNLAVHQDCYGVPYIPEGQWLCRKCTVSPEIPVPCVFCPNEGGAFKQTTSGQWAHLLCAMFIPEVAVGNMLWMEPIDNVEKVPKSRWKLTCSLCKIRHGACIQCDKNTCFAAFHVTCARRAKLLMGMKGLAGEDASYKGYCEKHLPEDVKKTRGEVGDIFETTLDLNGRAPKSSKSARAYSKKYSLGPPLVPQIIADKLDMYYKKHFRNKQQFIQLVCKYWSLKREARRGAPLLKRLHLEPWTASTATKQQTDQEKALKLQYLIRLRNDLEKVRMLAELTRKREHHKLSQAQLLDTTISKVLFPQGPVLKSALEQIKGHDKNELFHRPVTRAEAPDYFDIIKHPMSFMGIGAKLEKGEYLDVESFKSDVNLVFDNAMLYNKRDTVFHKTAARLKASAAHILASLDYLAVPRQGGGVDGEPSFELGHVGNLEADVENLKPLLSEESIKDDTDLIIEAEPIASLFRIEHERRRPPPPPPLPPPPKPKKEKPRRDYKVEKERRRHAHAALAAENSLLLDTSPGFRAPRATRSTRAALAALEAEIAAESSYSPVTDGGDSRAMTSDPSSSLQDVKVGSSQQDVKVDSIVADVEVDSSLPGVKTDEPQTPTIEAGEGDEPQTPVIEVGVDPETQRPGLPRKPRSWRRDHVLLPGQGAPNMVESMDNQGSFKNFDRGWILPSGSRRHGRAIPDLPPTRDLPSPKKRARTDRGKSRLSVVSTEPMENLTLKSNSPPGAGKNLGGPSDAMEVDQTAAGTSQKEPNTPNFQAEYLSPVHYPQGEIGYSPTSKTVSTDSILPTRGVKRKWSGTQRSEPSEQDIATEEQGLQLSESSGKNPSKKQRNSHPPTAKAKPLGPPQGMISLREGEMVLGGTLVWAKMDSYPWWAAVVWEEDTKGVPMNVIRNKAYIPRTEPGPLTLVQFYDRSRSWQWLELSCLRLLGEDKYLDDLLLSGRGKIQTFRTPRLRQGCRNAYREAIAEMEEPEGETNEGTTNASVEPSASAEPMLQDAPNAEQREKSQAPEAPVIPEPTSLPAFPPAPTPPPPDPPSPLDAPAFVPERQQSPPETTAESGADAAPLEDISAAPTENPTAASEIVRAPSVMSSELSELDSDV